MLRCWLAMLIAILASPVLAQTDDRILNDVVTVLAGRASVEEMARRCAIATDNDPDVAAAFEGFRERSTSWQIIAVTLIGTRGAIDPKVLARERKSEIAKIGESFDNDPDPARSCRDFAKSIADGTKDVSLLYPAETRRMSEARAGKWPVLDVAHSPEVADALAMKRFFFVRERLLNRCGVLTGNARLYADALAWWNQQNYDAFYYAHQVLTNWGALAPWRVADARSAARRAADDELSAQGVARCRSFVAGLKAGAEDVEQLVPDLLERVRAAAAVEP